MRRLEFSPEATADLADIGGYIARDNPERARTFVDELEARCAGLIEYPDTGRARADLAPGLRSKPHGDYLIFYTPSEEVVRIERVLHGARDVEGEFSANE